MKFHKLDAFRLENRFHVRVPKHRLCSFLAQLVIEKEFLFLVHFDLIARLKDPVLSSLIQLKFMSGKMQSFRHFNHQEQISGTKQGLKGGGALY